MSSFALMTNYEIFDLLYSEFREKFEFDEVVFTQRYVVGNKRIRLHFCKMKKKKNDGITYLDFLSKLQEKCAFGRYWSPFYFHCFEYFVPQQLLQKKMALQKEHDLAQEYFLSMDSNLCFHHLVGTQIIWYVVSFKRKNDNFNGDEEKKK